MYSLPAARSVDWSLSGYPSGIPTVTTIACNVRNFGAKGDGTSDDTDAFESAINLTNTWDATTPKVCYIPSGTYKITRRLYPKSGMVFRGDGSNTTTLKFYLGSAYSMHCFEIMGSVGSYQAIVSGATKGSNAIVVTDATNFAAGDVLDLRQSNNNDWWTTDVRDYQKVGDAGTVGAYAGSSSQGDWAVNCRGEMAIVQGKVGNTITLDHALFTTLDATKSPSVAEVTAKKNIGFEYLKVERGDAPSDEPASWGCHFFTQYANKVWWKGIYSYKPSEHHFIFAYTYQAEIRQSYIHDAWNFDWTGEAYGVDMRHHCTCMKIEDCCIEQCAMGIGPCLGTCGSYFGYNYFTNHKTAPIDTGDTWICDVDIHGFQAHHNLFEGNVLVRFSIAEYWGPCPLNTLFRNRIRQSIEIYDKSNDCSAIGNEVYHTGTPQLYTKSNVTGTLWHGNELNGAVQWATGQDQTLPNSLVYGSKPSWWDDNCAWPPIGPDVPTDMPPAQYRYANCSKVPQG